MTQNFFALSFFTTAPHTFLCSPFFILAFLSVLQFVVFRNTVVCFCVFLELFFFERATAQVKAA
jgi:hypothetical protein